MSITDNDDPRPLYAQVRDQLVERIRSGDWKPGQLIPNEFEIAAEFGVSQGTARKAISELAAERPGAAPAGTRHVRGRAYAGARAVPLLQHRSTRPARRSRPTARRSMPRWPRPTGEERKRLGLEARREVIRITRTRTRDGKPFIAETIALPAKLFPGLVDCPTSPTRSTTCSRSRTAS